MSVRRLYAQHVDHLAQGWRGYYWQKGVIQQLRGPNFKVKTILKGSLDLIPSPSTSMKIQIMDGKVCLITSSKFSHQ